MANIHGIEVSGETYDLEDSNARQGVQTNANDIDGIEGKIPDAASSSNKLATQNDITELCKIVSTSVNIPIGFEIDQTSDTHPGCAWSVDTDLTKPAPNAIPISWEFPINAWFPNVSMYIRGNSVFSLISKEPYIFPSDTTISIIWAIPQA